MGPRGVLVGRLWTIQAIYINPDTKVKFKELCRILFFGRLETQKPYRTETLLKSRISCNSETVSFSFKKLSFTEAIL